MLTPQPGNPGPPVDQNEITTPQPAAIVPGSFQQPLVPASTASGAGSTTQIDIQQETSSLAHDPQTVVIESGSVEVAAGQKVLVSATGVLTNGESASSTETTWTIAAISGPSGSGPYPSFPTHYVTPEVVALDSFPISTMMGFEGLVAGTYTFALMFYQPLNGKWTSSNAQIVSQVITVD
jgi:hypothetical protein